MNRTLKILSFAVILFLGYMWVSILYKSCNKESEFSDFPTEGFQTDQEVPGLSEEEFSSSDDQGSNEIAEDSDEDDEPPIDYTALDNKIEEKQSTPSFVKKESPTSKPTAAPAKTSYDGGERYMVISGNYILETNADVMVKKLQELGYANAEKVNFDLSQFHSVCAGRYNDYTKAVQLVSELKRRGIDAYVHRKQ